MEACTGPLAGRSFVYSEFGKIMVCAKIRKRKLSRVQYIITNIVSAF